MALARRDVLWLAGAVLVALVCVRLGIWQLARLHQRLARNAEVRAGLALPPVVVTGRTPAESLVHRRVRVQGVYDFAHEGFWRPRSFDEEPGVDLVTPLRLPDGAAVLVDRGFAASPDAYHVDEEALHEPDTADVVGLALAAPRGRGDVDPKVFRDSVPYPLLGVIIQALPDTVPRPGAPPLRRWPLPELSNGPHLSYAIQWFSFAIIIVAGSIALVRQGARDDRRKTGGERRA